MAKSLKMQEFYAIRALLREILVPLGYNLSGHAGNPIYLWTFHINPDTPDHLDLEMFVQQGRVEFKRPDVYPFKTLDLADPEFSEKCRRYLQYLIRKRKRTPIYDLAP